MEWELKYCVKMLASELIEKRDGLFLQKKHMGKSFFVRKLKMNLSVVDMFPRTVLPPNQWVHCVTPWLSGSIRISTVVMIFTQSDS